jgi:hypothetical protein
MSADWKKNIAPAVAASSELARLTGTMPPAVRDLVQKFDSAITRFQAKYSSADAPAAPRVHGHGIVGEFPTPDKVGARLQALRDHRDEVMVARHLDSDESEALEFYAHTCGFMLHLEATAAASSANANEVVRLWDDDQTVSNPALAPAVEEYVRWAGTGIASKFATRLANYVSLLVVHPQHLRLFVPRVGNPFDKNLHLKASFPASRRGAIIVSAIAFPGVKDIKGDLVAASEVVLDDDSDAGAVS